MIQLKIMSLGLKTSFKFFLAISFAIIQFFPIYASETVPVRDSSGEYTFAHYLYDNGDYANAAYEFVRLYLSADSLDKVKLAYNAGISFYNAGKYDRSYKFLKIAQEFGNSRELITKIYIKKGKYDKALESVEHLEEDRRLWLKAKIFRLSGQYEREKEMLQMINHNPQSKYFSVSAQIYDIINTPLETKSYLNAFMLSLLPLPAGAGYIYTQRYGDAVFANIFIISLAALGAIYYVSDSPNRAYLAWSIAGGFYLSAIYGSLVSVRLFNEQVQRNRSREINDIYQRDGKKEDIWHLSY